MDRADRRPPSRAERERLAAGLGPLASRSQLISTPLPGHEHLPKLSESLIELARPLVEPIARTASDEMLNRLFSVVALAWNTGLNEMDGEQALADQSRETLRTIARNTGAAPEAIEKTFEHLVAERKARFADDPRMVGSVDVVRTPGGLRVNAATIVMPPKP